MQKPLVSICIPAYNASKYIAETLNSVKNQTYTNWEIIVVEDATMDGTKEIVEKFGRGLVQKVGYIRNNINSGPSATRNIAASTSNGEWIAFLDSDDLWHEDHLKSLIETSIENLECELIHSAINVFDSLSGAIINEKILPDQTAIERFPISLFDRTYSIMPSQVMVTRNLFEATGGFNLSVSYAAEDLEMWLRCARENFSFAFTGRCTCFYRKHSEALTSNGFNMALGIAKVLDIYYDWEVIPKKLRLKCISSAWFSAARMFRNENIALAKQCLKKSIKYDKSLKNIAYWFLLRLPISSTKG